ncbi:peptidase M14 [Ornithobacterium rhinotracheale]|uniref:M14 family zinc carboxypeptidase n=1 Tax=Ornithobacterium rhinotracheale TaxID=28251 RepID=UPI00129C5A4F|nr:M14 family zinc carboxypeptidase [Ornithobacterium rhinotracheale]MRJ08691.1 peptidase M14 [Ornithobacterium rhinotracheale]UOH76863.1 peptidase M14 [Ornithobacterium rhinotracheale]
MNLESLFNQYNVWKEGGLNHRYFPPQLVEDLLQSNAYQSEIIGQSFQGRSIHKLTLGIGERKVLLWSQMHGNESSATRAMFDIFKLLTNPDFKEFSDELLQKIQIEFIPQLNPDGAYAYTRRNAMGIDVNRDFLQTASPEMQVLQTQVKSKVYKCLFNLHDQRTIFNVYNSQQPATLSLLAPVSDKKGTITDSRKQSMHYVSEIYKSLQMYQLNIARFSDEFYPKATGDNFQKWGIPIILFESGHFPNDYQRNETRKITAFGILAGLYNIAFNDEIAEDALEVYHAIPQNDNKAIDIIYRSVVLTDGQREFVTDIGVQYEEVLNREKQAIDFVPKIYEIGDLSDRIAHETKLAENCVFHKNPNRVPKIGEIIDL